MSWLAFLFTMKLLLRAPHGGRAGSAISVGWRLLIVVGLFVDLGGVHWAYNL